MNSTSVPGRGALSGDPMLPFSLWGVAELVDGQRSVNAIAAALNLPVSAVMKALSAIEDDLGAPLPLQAQPARVQPAQVQAPPVQAPPPQRSAASPGDGVTRDSVTRDGVTESALALLTQLAVELVGPMGELMVEDVLDELGEDAGAAEIARRVADELPELQRGAFLMKVRAKGLL